MYDEGSGTAVIKMEENGQNKPPTLNFPHKFGKLSVGGLFCPFSSIFITAVSRTLIIRVCVTQKVKQKHWVTSRVQRSCNGCNQNARMCQPALVYTQSVPEFFPIEELYAQYIRRDGCRKIFVRCSANVLRPNTEGGKQKPTRTVRTRFNRII